MANSRRPARVVTFLAPNMWPIYAYTLTYVSQRLNYPMELVVGNSYDAIADADFCFICGLPYVLRTAPRLAHSPLVAIAAPVLQGERYQNRPIYFSDVIVHRDSPFSVFADLRGRTWAFNEPESQSGYGITRYWLTKLGETRGYFGRVIEAGFHQKAIQMVRDGAIDAAAIDSQVLSVEFRNHPMLASDLRIIHTFGPSTIQPFCAGSHIAPVLCADILGALLEMHHDPAAAEVLGRGFIDHFVAVSDSDYDDIRAMLRACEEASFLVLR